MPLIDWDSSKSSIFANPKLSPDFYPSNWEGFKDLSHHIWIATSGTTEEANGAMKWVALSKQAFLASASAVNGHLKSTASDIWLNALPLFHVGGLSIYARAFLSGACIHQLEFGKWSSGEYRNALRESQATLSSLVPAQLYDLLPFDPPPTLRGLIIGGGAVSHELYNQAKKWPIMPSFGMTECCSQIATAHLGEFDLTILPHVKCTTTDEGLLSIESPALLTGYLHVANKQFRFEDPKKEGKLTTEDLVKIENNVLKFMGRKSDWIKIGGENVSLFQLETFFNKIKPMSLDAFLKPIDDARLGKVIQLVTLKKHEQEMGPLIQAFNKGVMPYEKIRDVHYVDDIPRTPLRKIIKIG